MGIFKHLILCHRYMFVYAIVNYTVTPTINRDMLQQSGAGLYNARDERRKRFTNFSGIRLLALTKSNYSAVETVLSIIVGKLYSQYGAKLQRFLRDHGPLSFKSIQMALEDLKAADRRIYLDTGRDLFDLYFPDVLEEYKIYPVYVRNNQKTVTLAVKTVLHHNPWMEYSPEDIPKSVQTPEEIDEYSSIFTEFMIENSEILAAANSRDDVMVTVKDDFFKVLETVDKHYPVPKLIQAVNDLQTKDISLDEIEDFITETHYSDIYYRNFFIVADENTLSIAVNYSLTRYDIFTAKSTGLIDRLTMESGLRPRLVDYQSEI